MTPPRPLSALIAEMRAVEPTPFTHPATGVVLFYVVIDPAKLAGWADELEALAEAEQPSGGWTQDSPRHQGWYWHWSGTHEESPLIVSVMWSGTSQSCFVSAGQLGLTRAIDCDDYGGWWTPLAIPTLPTEAL